MAEFVGIPDDTPRYRPAGAPKVDREPLFIREHDLCIGCLRCVRMCREIRQIDALGFVLDESGLPVVGTRAETLEASGCHWCLSCVEVCPTGALQMKGDQPRRDGVPVAACVAGCPAGIDIPRYLREIRRGQFARAEAVVRQAAPLPRVLGQVCFHPCEEVCLRNELGREPLAICALKRAVGDAPDLLAVMREAHRVLAPHFVAADGAEPDTLGPTLRARIMAHYRDGNDRVRRRFFPGQAELFPPSARAEGIIGLALDSDASSPGELAEAILAAVRRSGQS